MSVDPSAKRCGSCARFVRVSEIIDRNGEVRRAGDCLLGVWPSPLYETNTCSQYVKKGTFAAKPAPRREGEKRTRGASRSALPRDHASPATVTLPEELLDMDADEFRDVLRTVLRAELSLSDAALGNRWEGGELVMKPGKEGIAEKRVPIETFFHKIVMLRDRLRVLEQKVNGHPKLSDEEKVQMQQYVTQCYGTLTTFNVLFAEKGDYFAGQKGDKDD
jgi:hypothetical protein